jgi:hypothetical protein
MEKAPGGSPVGVDDPYEHVGRCDHLTDEGQCRWAVEHGHHDPEFANERSKDDFQCPVAGDTDEEGLTGPWEWKDCPHFRCQNRERECERCGLEAKRMAHTDERPLLEEHHLSYSEGSEQGEGDPTHEITVFLCRWCHAKVHNSWARVTDDVNPDPEAVAEQEGRKSRELDEMGFQSAAERFDDDGA